MRDAGVENPRRETRLLWEHASAITLSSAFVKNREILFEEIVQRRVAREPFAYITGEKEFWSLPFAVGPGVLVPRPETETLIEEALRLYLNRSAPLRILDLGTGSGCLLLTLLRLFPNASGVGIDASDQALGCAVRNAKRLGLDTRCRLLKQDWSEFDGSGFDLVVSNPPYIESEEIASLAPEVSRYEPHTALDGGADGLDAYRALALRFSRFLASNGAALIELGAGQADAVALIFEEAGYGVLQTSRDLSGIPRCITIRSNRTMANVVARNRLETAA